MSLSLSQCVHLDTSQADETRGNHDAARTERRRRTAGPFGPIEVAARDTDWSQLLTSGMKHMKHGRTGYY